MLMNQLHCRSSSSSSVAPNIEAVLPDQQLFYLKKSGNTSISAPSTNNNPLGRFLNKLPKPTIIDGIGHTKRHSVVGDRDDEFRIDSKMVHKTSGMNNRKDSMSRSHSWIYGSVKQSSPKGALFDDFGRPNGRDQVPSNYPYDSDICDCADSSSNKFHPVSSVRLKEKSDWRNYAFNDCPQHSPIGKQSSVKCDNNVSNGKKFVGSVRKLTWKSLKQVVKKRPSLDALKKQQNPPQSVHLPPPANAPDILFVPNYYLPPAKQNFYASCTDLYDEFPSHPTASVRVRPKPNRQPWPCEFGPLPNYHDEEGEEESEEIYHSEWDLRQFMPYDVWLAENSPPPRSNNRVMPKVKSNSHTVDNTAIKKTTESAGGQGQKNRLSILQSEVTAYELNRSDEDSSSSFDCHSSSSEDLPNRPTEQSLLPKVNGKTSQIHNRPAKQESWDTARKSTSLTSVNTISASTAKFCGTRSTTKSSPKVPVESDRKTSNGATPAAVEKTSVSNKITSRVGASRVSHVSSSSSAPPPSGEQVKLVHKGSAAVASKKKVEADVTKRRETTEINNENVRKNALKRNKSGPIESPALRNDVVQKDESEDDDDEDDEPEQQQPIYAVKILVSQNNNSSNNNASSDYVKPILKKESVYETPNITQVKYSGQQCFGPSTTTTVILTDDVNRNKKIVQFDQSNPIVCGGLTDDGGTESDDTLVWDDPKELIDGLDNSTKRAISQVSISCSDEGKTSSSFNDNNAHHRSRFSSSTGVNNLTGEENNHPQPTEEKKKKEDIKMEVNKNETLRAFPGFKADRMAKMAERKTVQVRPSTIQITNPNSLLFHDTTRIRLNQSRPSVDQAFKLEGRSKSSHGRPAKVKQSSSFRQMGSTPLRPREPPPPPPARQTISKIPKQGEMKGSAEKRTSSVSALRESVRRLNKNGNVTSSPGSKSSTKQSFKSAESVGKNNSNDDCKKPTNGPTKMEDDDKNIEIVTKENSVSEIRIYSGTQNLQIDHSSQAAQVLKNYGEKQAADAITMSHNTAPSDTKSRPLSTSVILIIDDTTSTPMNPEVSIPKTFTKLQPLDVLQESPEAADNVSNVPQMEFKDNKRADELHQNNPDKMEPLYDDVITRTAEAVDKLVASFRESRSLSPPPLPSVPPPLPSVPPPSDSYGSSCSNMYNKIRELKSENPDTVYDDTMSILSSTYSTSGVKANYEKDNMPLYDDVLNILTQDSDSGAESEGIPPPLPAQRSTLPLPKISTDLPMLSFPLLRQQENQLHTQTSSQLGDHTCSSSDMSSNRAKDTGSPVSEDIVERTRTLLSELSQKFNSLKFATPADYATYVSKVIISSSSDSSSGVEEDYGSEKNYPSSNNSSNSPTTVQKESSPEPLLSARGRFLDSMKTAAAPSSLPHIAEANSCAEPVEEPIYEEIGEEDDGPIYSDAFATKSMFDGASRSEILTFLEAIRERLSTSVSDSASNSLSRSEKGAEIERNDSGIGSGSESGSLVAVNGNGGSKSAPSSSSHFICTDCNDTVDTTLAKVTATGSGSSPHYAPLGTAGDLLNQASSSASSSSSNLCQTCVRKRRERKETLQEIYETEVKYGRDLRIIQEEFYNPIQIAGLLMKEQLEQIFLNVDQLCRVNTQLTGMLKSAIDDAVTTQDEDLTRVNVGKIFMEYGDTMMSAFEVYCTQQANAGALLTQLEKEKELLRIFLRVSQMENSVLRRMNLPAFLMVPVQRVTRYPLLMARLLKVTPITHPSRAELFAAQVKIEQHLESMNKRTREASSIRLWRRISIMNGGSSPSNRPVGITDSDDTTTRIRKMSLDVLDWSSFTDVTCVAEGCFDVVEFNGKPIRSVQACFLVRGKNLEILARKMERPVFFPPKEDLGIDAKLVLVRVKNSRFALLREPLCLSKCVVSQGENEYHDYVEINEITTKNTLFLRTAETDRTTEWLRVLQCHAACAGHWRRRRGALANIMMNGMIRHL